MNTTEHARVLHLEAGLSERVGGHRPPDLAAMIVERHLAGDAGAATVGAEVHRRPLRTGLAAAAVLIAGIATVVTVAVRQPDGGDGTTAAAPNRQDPWPPEPVEVHGAAAIAALPIDTRAVRCVEPVDADVAALARLRNLEFLQLHGDDYRVNGMGLEREQSGILPNTITDAAFVTLGGLTKLRHLDLDGMYDVSGARLGALTRLPVLSFLRLRHMYTDEEALDVLAKMPALAHLDLSYNYGVVDPAIDAILRCPGLRSLALRGCYQLGTKQLVRLAELPNLEALDLADLDRKYVDFDPRRQDARAAALLNRAWDRADWPGAGVTDAVLVALARAPALRALHIDHGFFTAKGIAALGTSPTLEVLQMRGATLTGDDAETLPPRLKWLFASIDDPAATVIAARLRRLEMLDVSASTELGDAGIAALVRLPMLDSLILRQCAGLTRGCVDSLVRAERLERLDLRDIPWVGATHLARLRANLPALEVLLPAPEVGK